MSWRGILVQRVDPSRSARIAGLRGGDGILQGLRLPPAADQ